MASPASLVSVILLEGIPTLVTTCIVCLIADFVFGAGLISRLLVAAWALLCWNERILNPYPPPGPVKPARNGSFWRICFPQGPPFFLTLHSSVQNTLVEVLCSGIACGLGALITELVMLRRFSNLLGDVVMLACYTDRIFQTNVPANLPARPNLDGLVWRYLSRIFPAVAFPSRKRLLRSLRPSATLKPFPPLPLDIQRDIVDACVSLAQSRNPRDLDFLHELSLVSRSFSDWATPALYHYLEIPDGNAAQRVMAGFVARVERPRADASSITDPIEIFKAQAPNTAAISFASSQYSSLAPTTQNAASIFCILVLLPKLERLSITMSMLGTFQHAKTNFSTYAADITVIMDRDPIDTASMNGDSPSDPWALALAAPHLRIRFSRTREEMIAHSIYDSNRFLEPLLLRTNTTHIAIETPVAPPAMSSVIDGVRSVSPVWEVMAGHLVGVAQLMKRIIVICWVTNVEEFVLPKMPEGGDKEVILFVPLESPTWREWTFESLEQRRLDFWEEAERIGVDMRGY